jgi:DNA-binding Xre family transcriptional regulator
VTRSLPFVSEALGNSKNISHMWETWRRKLPDVAASLQKQLGQFLRQRRGALTYPAFARKLGISSSSLHRMEMGEQNVTLNTLEHLLKRMKCKVTDIFSDPPV